MQYLSLRHLIHVLRNKKKFILLLFLVSLAFITSILDNKRKSYMRYLSEFPRHRTEDSDKVDPSDTQFHPILKPIPNLTEIEINEMLNHQRCRIPTLDPFHPEILPHLRQPVIEGCRLVKYGSVNNRKLRVSGKDVVSVGLYYIQRVDDFNIKFSDRIALTPDLATANEKKECLEQCGGRPGHCPSFCGSSGFCCKKGDPGCPNDIPVVTDHYGCASKQLPPRERLYKDCWKECGERGGHCPSFCGDDGYCCRKGFPDCPTHINYFSDATHSCVYDKPSMQDLYVEYDVTEEFFKVEVLFNDRRHEEYHYAFIKKPEYYSEEVVSMEDQRNIIMILFDSVSYPHMQRSLKKTHAFLKKNPRNVFMKGETIVGDGTTSNLCAMLTGISEGELPEARRGFANAKPVDSWPFIFKDMNKRNYKTAFAEQDVEYAMFNYRLTGWNKNPTTHYLRPLWHAMEDMVGSNGASCAHRFHLDYIEKFFRAYRERNKFVLVFNALVHNIDNKLENADDDLLYFYRTFSRSEYANNTLIIFAGDHGLRTSTFRSTLQGKMEERLPVLSITLPGNFDAYPLEMKNIRRNSHLLTSHFDIHATLQHILTFPKVNKDGAANKYGKSFFTDISKLNRTCKDAGVDTHWCTCLNYKSVNATDSNVLKLVGKVIDFINQRNEGIAKGMCSKLSVKKIIRAGWRTPNTEVNQFKGTLTKSGGCDSCEAEFDETKKFTRYQYEIIFSVSPSGGEYEAVAEIAYKKDGGSEIFLNKDISRTNLYGSQAHCVSKRFPHLRKYCYCVNQT